MGEMNFNEFCGNTSLHGWRFVPGTAGTGKFGIVGRAIWIFIVVSSIGVAAFFIAVALNDFFSSTGKFRFYSVIIRSMIPEALNYPTAVP